MNFSNEEPFINMKTIRKSTSEEQSFTDLQVKQSYSPRSHHTRISRQRYPKQRATRDRKTAAEHRPHSHPWIGQTLCHDVLSHALTQGANPRVSQAVSQNESPKCGPLPMPGDPVLKPPHVSRVVIYNQPFPGAFVNTWMCQNQLLGTQRQLTADNGTKVLPTAM